MARKEVLFVTEASGLVQNIQALDKFENQICVFKGGSSGSHSLCFVGDTYVLSAEKNKPLIQVWSLNRVSQQTIRIVTPAPVLSLAVDPSGSFCAGSCGEKILIWQLSTGHLVKTVTRHYQDVTTLKFSDCGGFLLSGGGEGAVNVWLLSDLVDQIGGNQVPEPHFSFAHHAVAVADIWIGFGGSRSRFASCSGDQTCNLYDLTSGTLLLKLIFDVGLKCVTSDIIESSLFLGSVDGRIFQVNLHPPPRVVECHITSESEELKKKTFFGHTGPITCLTVSRDGTLIASGSTDNSVILWDISSKNRLRTFLQKGAITNLKFRLMSRNMERDTLKQSHVIASFKRQYEDNPCNIAEVVMASKMIEENVTLDDVRETPGNPSVPELQNEIDELKAEKEMLYQICVKEVLNKCNSDAKKHQKKKKKKSP
ncbi:WD repeat-containing protein 18-like [Artemia franciscana]|uniref:WD repeat-containing protein 18 n=1 Tax=Artemia franciscana TaxID=6661 RepID=A0AA88HJ14_ARTSF|nr:hypothetical protein QYM36_015985 [Artemia franciscana]KAK2705817.1 hypothetical protein QYM36_015985 [Artemia franciscana]KAK2705818.1 hypothetical protein QYM36_015985 [Artemia franciscana]